MSNERYLAVDVAAVLADIDNLLTAYPELADDDDLKRDCIEGQTDAYSVLSRLISIERDADSLGKAIAARITDLQARKARADRKKDAMRALMLRILQAIGERKATLVEATVSVSKGRDSVEVTDVAALPDAYVKIERVPDKKAIMAALANDNVPGAAMRTGSDTLTVRAA